MTELLRRSTTLNEDLQTVLNEKLGITGNTSATVDYIIRIFEDCLASADPYKKDINDILYTTFPQTKYLKLCSYKDIVDLPNKKGFVFKFIFNLPASSTMLDWLSADSIVIINIYWYVNPDKWIEDKKPKGDMFSTYRVLSSGKTEGVLNIDAVLINPTAVQLWNKKLLAQQKNTRDKNSVFKPFDALYISGYSINELNDLKPLIQHELNHIHKTKNVHISKDLNDKLMKLINIDKNKYNAFTEETLTNIKMVANCIYRYGINTEREAFTEQFYKEWMQLFSDNVNMTLYRVKRSTYKQKHAQLLNSFFDKTKTIQDFNTLKTSLYTQEKNILKDAEIFHSLFKEIACKFLKIPNKSYKPEMFVKIMIDKIKKCMKIFYDRCERATHVCENYPNMEAPLNEWIEEIRTYIY